jgi:hypothetical protein
MGGRRRKMKNIFITLSYVDLETNNRQVKEARLYIEKDNTPIQAILLNVESITKQLEVSLYEWLMGEEESETKRMY